MSESFLSEIKDNRRKEGRRYESGHIPLFTISAIAGGACPYGKVHTFIKGNYGTLREEFGLKRKKIRFFGILRGSKIRKARRAGIITEKKIVRCFGTPKV